MNRSLSKNIVATKGREIRLNAYLARAGVCSRRAADKAIQKGDVTINGTVVTVLGTMVREGSDHVCYRGKEVHLNNALITIALHKPVGVVSSCVSQRGEQTVLDLVHVPYRLYPVGRLDKDSSGLILLTNDGALALTLTHPRYEHEKEYIVTLQHPLNQVTLSRLKRGMILDGKRRIPFVVEQDTTRRIRMVLREGRKRHIRRMVQMIGNEVISLKRIRIGSVRLDTLKSGEWRALTDREIASLQKQS